MFTLNLGRWAARAIVALLVFGAQPVPIRAGTPETYTMSYDLEAKGRYREALTALEKIPAPEQRSYTFLLRRGWLAYLSGQHRVSAAAYRAAAALKPRAVEPLLGLTLPLLVTRRWRETIAATQRILALDEANYLGLSRAAYALYNLGRYAKAEQHYRAVLRLYPSDLEMRTGLGWALLKQGRRGEAARSFRRVLDVAATHASAAQGLGLALK